MKTLRQSILPFLVLVLAARPAAGQDGSDAASLEARFRAAAQALEAGDGAGLVLPPEDLVADRGRLVALVRAEGDWGALTTGERAGVLVALADRTALEGDRAQARTLYGILETCGAPRLADWATYMTAGLDFAAGAYVAAADRYDLVCGRDDPRDWRDHACAMAGLARRLGELQATGGDHDDPVPATP